uniref:Uncharacterized protein n=1 Tax=Arundo donax TaxID=35708 RepID=A0A0A8XP95_ARUDO
MTEIHQKGYSQKGQNASYKKKENFRCSSIKELIHINYTSIRNHHAPIMRQFPCYICPTISSLT